MLLLRNVGVFRPSSCTSTIFLEKKRLFMLDEMFQQKATQLMNKDLIFKVTTYCRSSELYFWQKKFLSSNFFSLKVHRLFHKRFSGIHDNSNIQIRGAPGSKSIDSTYSNQIFTNCQIVLNTVGFMMKTKCNLFEKLFDFLSFPKSKILAFFMSLRIECSSVILIQINIMLTHYRYFLIYPKKMG